MFIINEKVYARILSNLEQEVQRKNQVSFGIEKAKAIREALDKSYNRNKALRLVYTIWKEVWNLENNTWDKDAIKRIQDQLQYLEMEIKNDRSR